MKFITAMFSEKGDVSMMRVLSFMSLCIAAYLAISGKDASVSVFVVAAFGGKVSQKFIEARNPSLTDNNQP